MVLTVFTIGVILIGWIVPRAIVMRMPSGLGVGVGSFAAMGVGVAFVWLGAQVFGALGVEEAGSAFDRGFNAWKIIIFLAPGAALHLRRIQMKAEQ